jgi:geranylgeranyl diphosphate synthase type II
MQACRPEIEQRLDALVRGTGEDCAGICEAMRYSLLAGGKRIRAILMMAVADTLVGSHSHVLDAACSLEMIHAYSLIHDDLPCMDDGDFRRGLPTSHRVFGEAIAVLAGDGLLTLAFDTLARIAIEPPITSERLLSCIGEIARGAGPDGMVGGQALDIANTGNPGITKDLLQSIHSRKTGALFRAAIRASAILSGADETALARLSRYGEALGLIFQIRDDILDVTGDADKTGKPASSDAAKGKASYPSVVGMRESEVLMNRVLATGRRLLEEQGYAETVLGELLEYAAGRDY